MNQISLFLIIAVLQLPSFFFNFILLLFFYNLVLDGSLVF